MHILRRVYTRDNNIEYRLFTHDIRSLQKNETEINKDIRLTLLQAHKQFTWKKYQQIAEIIYITHKTASKNIIHDSNDILDII